MYCVCVCVSIVTFYVLFVCKCVLPPGGNPIAVNKYIISYDNMNHIWWRGWTAELLTMQFSAARCLFCRGGAGARGSSMFGPNVIETRGPVLVTRLSPCLDALFQATVINSCAVYIASVHLGEMAYLQTMLVRRIWPSEDRASWYILIMKANEMHYFSNLFDKVLYIFRTCPLPIIGSLSTLYTRNRYLSG
jgi:hypothetical protein